MTDEGIKQVIDRLRGEQELICFDSLHGESCHSDELNSINKSSYDLINDAIHLIEKLDAENAQLSEALADSVKGSSPSMTDEIERLIDRLRDYKINVGELRYDFGDADVYPTICSEAADALEKLTAECDRWKARCEAAEKDMKTLANSNYDIDLELPCKICAKYYSNCYISDGDTCFEWRGAQEEENNE